MAVWIIFEAPSWIDITGLNFPAWIMQGTQICSVCDVPWAYIWSVNYILFLGRSKIHLIWPRGLINSGCKQRNLAVFLNIQMGSSMRYLSNKFLLFPHGWQVVFIKERKNITSETSCLYEWLIREIHDCIDISTALLTSRCVSKLEFIFSFSF